MSLAVDVRVDRPGPSSESRLRVAAPSRVSARANVFTRVTGSRVVCAAQGGDSLLERASPPLSSGSLSPPSVASLASEPDEPPYPRPLPPLPPPLTASLGPSALLVPPAPPRLVARPPQPTPGADGGPVKHDRG